MKIYRFMTTVALAALVVAGAVLFSVNSFDAPSAAAQGTLPETTVRTVTVVGEGTVSLTPDIAETNIGVEVMRASVQEATSAAEELMQSILSALAEQGIAEEDIQTSGYSVYAERYGPEGPLADDETQYRVSNNVQVTIRDIDSVGEVLDAAVEAGANNIYGVNFRVEDPSGVESEAREAAFTDAREKASELASLSDAQLGQVMSISEIIGNAGFYQSSFDTSAMASGLGGGGGFAPGEQDLVMQLQITFELTQ